MGGKVPPAGHPNVLNSCSVRLPVAEMALEKLMVHIPVQAGTTKQRKALTVPPFPRETSTMSGGKGIIGPGSSLTKTLNSGRMTVARGVRSGSAKPEAKVEREIAAMRVSFMVGRRR